VAGTWRLLWNPYIQRAQRDFSAVFLQKCFNDGPDQLIAGEDPSI